jgi:hypothetical protein
MSVCSKASINQTGKGMQLYMIADGSKQLLNGELANCENLND